MRSRTHYLRFCTLVIVILLTLAACGPATPTEPTPEPEGEEVLEPTSESATEAPEEPAATEEPVVMRVGVMQEPDCMYSYYHCSTIFSFSDLIMEGFKAFGPSCDSVPRLAEAIEYSEDGLTITIHMREGATWNDGESLDATDVAAWFELMQDLELSSWHLTTANAESWEVVDEHTFQFTNSIPVSKESFESGAAVWDWVIPPQVYSGMDEDTFWDYSTDEPVTAGPYSLTEWSRGSYMILEARSDYWAGKPPVDRIVFQFYANADAMINALLSGEIDTIPNNILPQYYDQLAGEPNLELVEQPAGSAIGLYFNVSEDGLRHPAVNDPRVREAIDYAIDRQHIIDVALFGKGIECPLASACGPTYAKALDPDIEATPYDPQMAKQILEEAGYLDTDNDGVRETPEGQPLEFRLYFNQDFPPNQSASDIVSEYLSEIGIQAEPTAMESGTLRSVGLEHDFDLAIYEDEPEVDPATDDWPWGCWSAEGGGENISGYCSEEFDETVFEILTSTGQERVEAIQKEQRILASDRPLIYLAGVTAIGAYRSDKFDIPADACPYWQMLVGWDPTMNTIVE